jgi:hypothetical protein
VCLDCNAKITGLVDGHREHFSYTAHTVISPVIFVPDDLTSAICYANGALAMSKNLTLSQNSHDVLPSAKESPYLGNLPVNSTSDNLIHNNLFLDDAARAGSLVEITVNLELHHGL